MEVLTTTTTTTTSRPRFIPTEPVVMPSATSTMTRSPISHQQQQQTCNNNGQANGGSSADTTIRDKTRLLQLAEKVHTRKSSSPNYAKSFRAISSMVSKNGNDLVQTPNVRRTNSTMFSSSSAPITSSGVSRSKKENYKNPKLYASFSSKSSSKLTKALIKSDPAKTNIEHLVNYKSPPKVADGNSNVNSISNGNGSVVGGGVIGGNNVNGKKSPSENGENNHNHHHHHQQHQHHQHNGSSGGGGGGGLSSFITPLKALHASFHERSSKLGQTRNKLFSHHHHRDISSSNSKLLFGTTENLHSSSSSSSEDILATSENNIQSSKERKSSLADQRKQRIERTKNISSRDRLQNGSSNSNGNGTITIPPDFLEGFRNENSCTTNNNNNNNNNKDHAATNKINGFDKPPDSRRSSNSSNNNGQAEENRSPAQHCMSSFITPDILGGCLDVPKPTLRNGTTNNNAYRINENDQKLLADELRQVNGTNYSCSPQHHQRHHHVNNVTNGQLQTPTDHSNHQHHAQQVAQPHFNSNNDISQKRKNIVVRMSYHDDETSYNDLYRICNNNENGDGQDNDHQQYADGLKISWLASSPIMVMSTVTPKTTHQSTTPNGTSSTTKVITSGATNNNYCGKDGPYNSYTVIPAATTNSLTSDNAANNSNKISSSVTTLNGVTSVNSFHCNGSINNCNTGGGVTQQLPRHRPASSLSCVSNSGVLSSSEDNQRSLPPQPNHQQKMGRSGSSVEKGQKHREPAEHHRILSRSPEATGSSTWLQIRNSSSTVGADSLNSAKENDNNNKPFMSSGLKKQITQKAGGISVDACSSALSNLNDSNCNGVDTDDFSVIVSTIPEGTEEERGRGRKGLFMEAETSFSHRKVVDDVIDDGDGGGRFQTALLSDEYAQYLGYDYDNRSDKVKKMQQTQASRLHVLQLGNQVVPAKENGENGGAEDENLTMLAIATSGSSTTSSTSGQSSRYGNNGVYQQYHHVSQNRTNNRANVSILKPHKSQGHKPIMHSVSFRGTDEVVKCLDDGNNKSCSESFSKFDRKRSRSLPKSFLSVRNGLRNVLPRLHTQRTLSMYAAKSS